MLDAVVGRVADLLELIGSRLDGIGRRVFDDPLPAKSKEAARKPDALREVMRDIGRVGDLTNKVRDSLAGLDRLTTYLATISTGRLNKEQKALLKSLSRDLRSLGEHAGYLSQQTNFLLDATLGVINIEQNAIIKIFSVVAVVFLPPTLIASIYGMNFHFMPELDKTLGLSAGAGPDGGVGDPAAALLPPPGLAVVFGEPWRGPFIGRPVSIGA